MSGAELVCDGDVDLFVEIDEYGDFPTFTLGSRGMPGSGREGSRVLTYDASRLFL